MSTKLLEVFVRVSFRLNSRIFSDRVGLRRTRTDKATTTTEDYLPGAVCGAADGFELELEPVEGQPEAKSWFG